jgi:hypothetical protein
VTAEKINKYNEVRSRLATFIADCLRGFGGQSVVSDSSLDLPGEYGERRFVGC